MELAPSPSPMAADAAPLAWIIDQVRDNLLGALTTLRRQLLLHAPDSDEARTLLLQARGQLHQAAGAIDLLGYTAAARLVQAAERAVARGIEQPQRLDERALQLLATALHAELDFLDAQHSGAHEDPVKLFKPYRALLDFVGDAAHPADLWDVDWSWPEQPDAAPAAALAPSVRGDYERALLELLRGGNVGAAGVALRRVAESAALAAQGHERTLWTIAAAFFEGIALGLLPPDIYVKRLCNRLNLQLKSLLGGQPQPAQRLANELLFFCSQALARADADAAPALRGLARALQLPPAAVVDYERDHFGRVDPALVQQVRRRLGQVKDGWAMLGNEDFSRVDRLLDALGQLGAALRDVQPGVEALPAAIERVVRALAAGREQLSPERVLEVATALLFLEAAFTHFRADDAVFVEHAAELAERLLRSADGEAAGAFAPWMEELYRRTSETQTLGSVVDELHHDMGTVERVLDAYFRDPATLHELAPVPRLLTQMRGVLSVLGVDVGAQALSHIRQQVDALMATPQGAAIDAEAFDQLAGNVGALGFLIDMLGYQPELAKSLFAFDDERGELRPLVSAPRRRAPRASDDTARAVQATAASPTPTPAATMPPPAAVEPPAAAPTPAPAAPLTADSVEDEELLGIFLDEAAEVVAAGRAVLVHLRADPEADDEAALGSVRRAFHTLKGSSRMVGLRDFGEAAWEMEQLFNQVLARQRAATLPLLDLAARAFTEFDAWTAALRAGDATGHSSAGIVGAARALRGVGGVQPDVPVQGPPIAIEQAAAEAVPTEAPHAPAGPELELTDALLLGLPESTPAAGAVAEAAAAAPEFEALPVDELPVDELPVDELTVDELTVDELTVEQALVEQPAAESADAPVAEAPVAAASEFEALPVDELPVDELPVEALPVEALPVDELTLEQALVEQPAAESADAPVAEAPAAAAPASEALTAVAQAPATTAVEAAAAAAPLAPHWPVHAADQGEADKVIGELRIPLALYNIYLGEADELVRRLHADLGAWAQQPQQPLAADTVALAHQLRGSSRTVGLRSVGDLAERLETVIELQRQAPHAVDARDAALLSGAIDDIRGLLHQFAAGFLRDAPPALEHALDALAQRLRAGAPPPDRAAFAQGTPSAPPSAAPVAAVPPELLDAVDAELFAVFEFEATELLPQLAAALRRWEAQPHDAAAPKQAMRLLHTFKGSARMAGAMALGEAAHRLEADIEALLGADSAPDAGAVLELIARCDALTTRFERLREGQLRETPQAAARTPTSASSTPTPTVATAPAPALQAPALQAPARARLAAHPVRVRAALLDRLVNQVGEVSIARARLETEFGQIRSSTRDLGDNLERLRTQVRDIELQADAQMAARAQAARDDGRDFDPLEFDRFTRFQELTRMMAESVNDLALVQGTLTRTLQATDDNLSRQARLTRDLQRDLLRTRMVEFDSIAERLYRTVRQAGKDAGKAVALDIVGGTIEIDRGVLDRMAGTFDHLLRNAVAHGLESPAQRAAAGKPATGTVRLSVRQEGSEVRIAVADDGAGLDDAAIAARARSLGLLAADAQPDAEQLHELIFRAGFSSMREANAMAGRGVGLDVVRNDTRALGGRVEVESVFGRGSTFTLVLPLTTAVTQVVLLRVGNRVYAVPSNLVDRVVRVKPSVAVEAAQQRQWRDADAALACYWFGALTGDGGASAETAGRSVPLVLVRSAAQRVALLVDEVLGNQEVVVKNLGPQLSRVPGLAGVSLLPEGSLVLIYNPVALAAVHGAQAARLMDEARAGAAASGPAEADFDDLALVPANTVLVVDDSITVRRVTQRFLSRNGYNVMLAKDGLDALEQLQAALPDVVLTDIEMPRMDGFDLTRNIRADERTRHLPVIMITSRIADKHRNYAEELGVDHYLGKPYSEDELLALIRRYAGVDAPTASA